MSFDAPSLRSSQTDAPDAARNALVARTKPPAHEGLLDRALAPVDHFKDALAGELGRADAAAEHATAHIPVLGQAMQFLTGAGSAIAGMAEGTYETIRHPVEAIKGIATMAGHVPGSPIWLYHGIKDGFKTTLESDKAFWETMGKGMVQPYVQDWKKGRYFAVAGRAAVDIGTIYLGVKQAENTIQSLKAARGARAAVEEVAQAHPAPEAGLKSALLGDDELATGEVLPEGHVVIGSKYSPESKLEIVHKARKSFQERLTHVKVADEPLPPETPALTTEETRAILEEAKRNFKGDRVEKRARALEYLLKQDKTDYRHLNLVGPKSLLEDEKVRLRYNRLTTNVERRMDREVKEVIGWDPDGAPKLPERAAAKLELKQKVNANVRLRDLDDVTRGRINMNKYDPTTMRSMLKKLKLHYGDNNLKVNDYMSGKPFYRGRLHVKIRDKSGLWYELQIGPKQLSTFYDTPFQLGSKEVCIHDAVYKGLMQLDDQAVAAIGKGNLRVGEQRLARVLDQYVKGLNEAMDYAQDGKPYVFEQHTLSLQKSIAKLVRQVPAEKLPIGLQ